LGTVLPPSPVGYGTLHRGHFDPKSLGYDEIHPEITAGIAGKGNAESSVPRKGFYGRLCCVFTLHLEELRGSWCLERTIEDLDARGQAEYPMNLNLRS
jgi:hypothetical protein